MEKSHHIAVVVEPMMDRKVEVEVEVVVSGGGGGRGDGDGLEVVRLIVEVEVVVSGGGGGRCDGDGLEVVKLTVGVEVVTELVLEAVVGVILVVDRGASGGDRGRDVEIMAEMMELVVVEWRCQRGRWRWKCWWR